VLARQLWAATDCDWTERDQSRYFALLSALDRRARAAGVALSATIRLHWFAIVKTFADTAYHREVLAECGHYRRWVAR
jgi:hypothetical protein